LDNQSSLAENQKTQDPFNRRLDWSRSSWDINHVLGFSYVYQIPFGRGRRFGANLSRAADLLVGGWTLEGINRLETGPPFMVFTSEDIANTGRKTQRLNYASGNRDPNAGPKTPEQWFNTAAFVRPAAFNFGEVSPYVTNADAIISLDIVLEKEFRITEGHAFELRGEFFNFPNTTSFGDPQGNINNAAFGRISGQRVSSRQIQMGLRYRF
ncbi:MAG: hypothetical protein ACRD96_24320, partial [Bryobacteraceae bacterium]